jgi:hypothetical protein
MIGTQVPAEAPLATLSQESAVLEVVISNGEVREDASVYETNVLPVRQIEKRQFSCQDYEFGYAICKNCHNDQAYYVHSEDLVSGYSFRCRVCRLDMTVWPKS